MYFNIAALVEWSFFSVFLGDKDLKHHTLQAGDFIYWKRYLQKDAFQPHCKGTKLRATKLQGIDSWIHMSCLKKGPNPDWTAHQLWPESKDFQELKQITAEWVSFPKMTGPGPYTLYSVSSYLICSLSFLVQSMAKRGNLSGYWMVHQKLQSVQCQRSLVLLHLNTICSPISNRNTNERTPFCKAFIKHPFRLGWFLAEYPFLILFSKIIFKLYTFCLSTFVETMCPTEWC